MAASDTSSQKRSIVILGGGVIGLTIAHVLSDDVRNVITVVARELPEHHMQSGGWASPWAGANWSPLGKYDERKVKWEKETVEQLRTMIPSGMVAELPYHVYYEDAKLCDPNPAWKAIVREFQEMTVSELPEGFQAGLSFTAVSLRPSVYLTWLKEELVKRGVSFISKHVGSIEEAAHFGGDKSIVINATGLGAKALLGVEDKDVYPIRGQTVIVDAPEAKTHMSLLNFTSKAGPTYIIPRPDGTVILGGTYQADNYSLIVDNETALGIFERCSKLEPKVKDAKVLSLNVGLRPARKGGARVEKELVQLPLKNRLVPDYGAERVERELTVIHAYGLGPAGYQSSWGVARNVAELLSTV